MKKRSARIILQLFSSFTSEKILKNTNWSATDFISDLWRGATAPRGPWSLGRRGDGRWPPGRQGDDPQSDAKAPLIYEEPRTPELGGERRGSERRRQTHLFKQLKRQYADF